MTILQPSNSAIHRKHGLAAGLFLLAAISVVMARIRSKEMYEAEELLAEVASWSDEEINTLPKFYRETAREYRRLANDGEQEDTSSP